MTKLEQIKAECRKAIELGEAATEGPWEEERIFGDWGFPYVVAVNTPQMAPSIDGHGIMLNYGGSIQCMGRPDPRNIQSSNDATHIAHARTFSPAAAKALLMTIEGLEETACWYRKNLSQNTVPDELESVLEKICQNWPDPVQSNP